MTFGPASVGASGGSVTINDTAGGSPHSYGLSGTGVQNGSSLNLQSSQAESTFGASVTFTATVTPSVTTNSTPTGSVVFTRGANTLGIVPVSNLQASLTTSALHAGSYSISASYGGDSVYGSSTATATQVVDKAVPALALASSANPVHPNTALQLTATVSSAAGTPSGAVTFMDGQSSLGSVAVNGSGVAVLSLNSLTGGVHSLTATYAGNADFTAANSSLSERVPDFTLAANPADVTVHRGQSATIDITGTPLAGFTGQVAITCTNLPQYASCTFNPATTTINGQPAVTVLTFNTTTASHSASTAKNGGLMLASWILGLPGTMGLLLMGTSRKRRRQAARFYAA